MDNTKTEQVIKSILTFIKSQSDINEVICQECEDQGMSSGLHNAIGAGTAYWSVQQFIEVNYGNNE